MKKAETTDASEPNEDVVYNLRLTDLDLESQVLRKNLIETQAKLIKHLELQLAQALASLSKLQEGEGE